LVAGAHENMEKAMVGVRSGSTLRGQRAGGGLGVVVVAAGACVAAAWLVTPAVPVRADSSSGIGQAVVTSIAVSPNVARTGLVVVQGQPQGGTGNRLWISHDGGATWHVAAASGWNQGRPVIASTADGHDVVFSAAGAGLERSDDGGDTWENLARGTSVIANTAPNFASNSLVAVGGSPDYTFSTSPHVVSGSGGAFQDMSFTLAPSFPNTAGRSPAFVEGVDSQNLVEVEACNASLGCSNPSRFGVAGQFNGPGAVVLSDDYLNDGVVFVQTGRGIYKSVNGGATYALLPVVTTNQATTATPMLALAPGYSERGSVRTVYVAVLDVVQNTGNGSGQLAGGLYRSSNGGAVWQNVSGSSPLGSGAAAVAVAPTGRVFAGYLTTYRGEGLLCSDDSGGSWQAACPPVGSEANDPDIRHYGGQSGPGSTACPQASGCAGASRSTTTGTGGGSRSSMAGGAASTASPGAAAEGAPAEAGAAIGRLGSTGSSGGGSPLRVVLIAVAAGLAVAATASWLVTRRRRGLSHH
jgi:hypothetical protein